MERLAAIERAVDLIVRGDGAEQRLREDPRAFFAAAGVDARDVDALAKLDVRRLLVYRRLVRGGLHSAIRVEMPRTASRLGDRFAALVDAFVTERSPRSHYLRDVAFEFLAWATPRLAADEAVPTFLLELARHELSAFEIGSARDRDERPFVELGLETPARFDPSVHLYRYSHAVHELSADEHARDEPRRAETCLLGYRDQEDEVRYLALSPLAADILERLLVGATLRAAIEAACSARGQPLEDAVLASSAAVLSDLVGRGALLGARVEAAAC